jgi:ABC-type uncharacterized transport system permease subunit
MELFWILGLLLVLFPQGMLRAYGWTRWPRRRQTRLDAWHLRLVGAVLILVAAAIVLTR